MHRYQLEHCHEHGEQIEYDDAQPEGVARIVQPSVARDDDANQQVDWHALRQAYQVHYGLEPIQRQGLDNAVRKSDVERRRTVPQRRT